MPPSSSSRRPTAPTRQSRALWHECALVGMPRAVVITQLDARDADFAATLADCQAHFGSGIQPLGVPLPGDGGCGDLDRRPHAGRGPRLRRGRRARCARPARSTPTSSTRTGPPSSRGSSRSPRTAASWTATSRARTSTSPTLEQDLLTAVAHGTFHPVLPLSAETGAGVDVLVHLVEAAFPHPGLHPLPTVTPVDGGAAGRDHRRPRRPARRRGRPHRVRRLRRAPVARAGVLRDAARRPGRCTCRVTSSCSGCRPARGTPPTTTTCGRASIAAPLDGDLLTKTEAIAGEVVVVTKLATAQTSDTLSSPDAPLLVTPWALPEALLPAAVAAASRADEDRMPVAFRELAAEDPSLRIEHDAGTGQVVLWTTGPAHLDLVLGRLRSRFNVGVEQVPVRVAMKETAVDPCRGPGPARQAVRRARPVRGLPPRHGAAPPRVGRRVRRGRRRRRRAAPVLRAASRRACTTSSRRACSPAGRSSTSR